MNYEDQQDIIQAIVLSDIHNLESGSSGKAYLYDKLVNLYNKLSVAELMYEIETRGITISSSEE